MKCEHDYVEREQGREESECFVDDGYFELVCTRCDDYQVVKREESRERELKGGE